MSPLAAMPAVGAQGRGARAMIARSRVGPMTVSSGRIVDADRRRAVPVLALRRRVGRYPGGGAPARPIKAYRDETRRSALSAFLSLGRVLPAVCRLPNTYDEGPRLVAGRDLDAGGHR